jgi:hypothetical protein
MKKKFLFLFVIFASIILSSCENSGLDTTSQSTDDVQMATLKSIPSIVELARYYAPVILQDVDVTDGWCSGHSKTGSADWITNVNYDANWQAYNNWDNLVAARAAGSIKAYVYYNYASTSTHWFILYSVYHPRDWSDILCGVDEHENDMEGILVCASRGDDGESYGNIEYVSTIWHSDKLDYTRSNVDFYGPGPKIYIESKGHGIRKYNGSSDKDGTYIVYQYTGVATQPLQLESDLPQSVGYDLLSLYDQLYTRKDNSLLFVGNAFRGDNYNANAANAPWAWGDYCLHPAQYIKDAFGLSDFDTEYQEIEIE